MLLMSLMISSAFSLDGLSMKSWTIGTIDLTLLWITIPLELASLPLMSIDLVAVTGIGVRISPPEIIDLPSAVIKTGNTTVPLPTGRASNEEEEPGVADPALLPWLERTNPPEPDAVGLDGGLCPVPAIIDPVPSESTVDDDRLSPVLGGVGEGEFSPIEGDIRELGYREGGVKLATPVPLDI